MFAAVKWLVAIALALGGCQPASLQNLANTNPKASPPAPGPTTRALARPPLFRGPVEPAPPGAGEVSRSRGTLRSGTITYRQPQPPDGFGRYIYVLPERAVATPMLDALLKFHACVNRPVASDTDRQAVSLLMMPIRQDPAGERIDVQLAHDLLRAVPIQNLDDAEVYFVVTSRPLRLNAPTSGSSTIRLGRIAPQYVGQWMIAFQDRLEQGTMTAPRDWLLAVRSAGLVIASVGQLWGIRSAQATPTACG